MDSGFSPVILCVMQPGVEASAGALGHGLSIAVGVALAGKKWVRNIKLCNSF